MSALPTRPQLAAARRVIEAEIERLIHLLDALGGDPDREPSLGWTRTMAWGGADDREEDAS